jgi:hypothetical protein
MKAGEVTKAVRNIHDDFNSELCDATGKIVGSFCCKNCQYHDTLNVDKGYVICDMTRGTK